MRSEGGSMKAKALEWKGDVQGGEDVCAKGLFGEYHVCHSNHGYGDLWSAIFNEECKDSLDLYAGEIGMYAQVERAKECCQIHHDKRVENALTFVEGICSIRQ
jgi:hypothetical protein